MRERIGFVSLLLMGFSVGNIFQITIQEWRWHKELVKRGHAQYNQTTGAWEWKDSGKGEGE